MSLVQTSSVHIQLTRHLRLLVLVCACVSVTCLIQAQKAHHVWYFGKNAGLDFNTTPPTPLSGSLTALEGTAAISDPDGQLLFYTNGITIWDRNHNVMPNGNGLNGGVSSTQAALIIPKPGSLSKYYVFTPEDHLADGDLAYTVVDMCLNNGLGAVDMPVKNIVICDNCAEKLTAVLHPNSTDVWILMHELESNRFRAYLLTENGLSAPVVSSIGSVHPSGAAIGPLKASHSGTKLVCTATFFDICEIFDFNPATGSVSNFIDLTGTFNNLRFVYGAEFSPNDRMLYLSTCFSNNYLHQFDLNINSQTTLDHYTGNYKLGALQLGPDGRIYLAGRDRPFLGVINNPNASGVSCAYTIQGQMLAAGTLSDLGLPNFPPYSLTQPDPLVVTLGPDTILCDGDTLSLGVTISASLDVTYAWNNGATADSIQVIKPGSYFVDVTHGCLVFTDTITILSHPLPAVNLGSDTTICQGDVVSLDVYSPELEYHWSDNSVLPALAVSSSGTYGVTVSNVCGSTTDEITIDVLLPPYAALQIDTVICDARGVHLNAGVPESMYIWSGNSSDEEIYVHEAGLYSVTITNICGSGITEFLVADMVSPIVELGNDTLLCEGKSLMLEVASDGSSYIWSDHSGDNNVLVDQPGLYSVTVTNVCGFTEDSIRVFLLAPPHIFSITDTIICEDQPFLVDVSMPGASYLWSDGTTEPINLINRDGSYSVSVYNACGEDYSDFEVQSVDCEPNIFIPNVFSPGGDGINDSFGPFVNSLVHPFRFLIYDRWGDLLFESSDIDKKWDGKFKGQFCLPGTYVYYVEVTFLNGVSRTYAGSVTLVR